MHTGQPPARGRAERFLPRMIVSRTLDVSKAAVPIIRDAGPALLADGVVQCAQRVAREILHRGDRARTAA
jgi:hypothetical protein